MGSLPGSLGPTSAHHNRLLPPPKLLCAILHSNLGVELGNTGRIDTFQLVEAFPNTNGKTCCNGSAESSGFEHCWALDWYTNKICLGLLIVSHLEGGILARHSG